MSLPDDNAANKLGVPLDYMLSAAEWRRYLDFVETSQSDQAHYPDVSAGLRLGIRGIEEDEKENCDEAMKLYEECRKHLKEAFKHVTNTGSDYQLVRKKFGQLQDRLFLLIEKRQIQVRGVHLYDTPRFAALCAGRVLEGKAMNAQENENYEEALRFYEECKKNFLHALEHDVRKDSNKDILCNKLKSVTDKIKLLEDILQNEAITDKLSQMNCN